MDSDRPQRRRSNDALMEALLAGNASRAGELVAVARDLLHATRLTTVQRWMVFTVMVVTAIAAVSASVDGILILRGIQHTRETTTLIKDCTTPTGQCYRRGQAQTGQAVDTIVDLTNRFTLIAVECAHVGGQDQVIAKCVLTKSKAQGLVK